MLPFLQPKKMASILIAKHTKDGADVEREEDSVAPGLQSAADDLLRAIAAKDSTGMANALQAAFDCADDDEDSEEVAGE